MNDLMERFYDGQLERLRILEILHERGLPVDVGQFFHQSLSNFIFLASIPSLTLFDPNLFFFSFS